GPATEVAPRRRLRATLAATKPAYAGWEEEGDAPIVGRGVPASDLGDVGPPAVARAGDRAAGPPRHPGQGAGTRGRSARGRGCRGPRAFPRRHTGDALRRRPGARDKGRFGPSRHPR